eukprot:TRINITY_DN10589_c0_g1_i1.p1 TRINITY_DN10589_c0_g1~~TRINITY_DN10589_c0_g1_i1.p1  ORF type:complete len:364 (+),score=74.11 TRINITY_DN10589_c0_g1_i1:165-1094(+)
MLSELKRKEGESGSGGGDGDGDEEVVERLEMSANEARQERRRDQQQQHKPDVNNNAKRRRVVKELVFWGGNFLNCQEDDAAYLVDHNALVLEKLTYFPNGTKGGALIRPKYYRGDRTSVVLFPKLVELSIPLHTGAYNTYVWGYNAPSLKHIQLLIDPKYGEERAARSKWRIANKAPAIALKSYPKLRDITAVVSMEKDTTRVRTPWAVLHTPRRSPWEVLRLLFIAYHKGDRGYNMATAYEPSTNVGSTSPSASESFSPLTLMPLEVIHHIIDYLWLDWSIERLNSFESTKREEYFPNLPDDFFVLQE